MTASAIRIGTLSLRPGRDLRGESGQIAIGGRALALLSVIAEARGATLTKGDLFENVWGQAVIEENALHAQISTVRKALGSEAWRLMTVHGRGYWLELAAAEPEGSASGETSSIAVLPFENRTPNAEHAYLADGLAEELIARLGCTPGLRVPARTSSFAFRDRTSDIRTIAAELGVATVLEGSVRAGGDTIRVTAQLIDAASGFTVWTESFDRRLTDLLVLQDDLAAAIAAALRQELQPRARETHSGEAMRLVLAARAATRFSTPEAMREALRLARAALEIDTDFAKAWESLAGSTFVMANAGFGGAELLGEARDFARRAIALDPALSGAHGILAGIEAASGRFVEAIAGFDHARALNPENEILSDHIAHGVYLPVGQIARARELADAGIVLARARAQPHLVRGICASLDGEFEAAGRFLEAALRAGQTAARPSVELLQSQIHFSSGNITGATQAMAQLAVREFAVPGAGGAIEAVFAALSGAGDPVAARAAVMALFEAADRSGTLWTHPASPGLVINWLARLDALNAAFAVAQRIVGRWQQTGRLTTASLNLFWLPEMAPFRRDPRFQQLVRELDLIRFWQTYGPPDGHRLVGLRLVEQS